jgi:Tfp pilus assembly protein PilE
MKNKTQIFSLKNSRSALSLIEVVFSILILSIISVVSIGLVSQSYKEYADNKSEIILSLEVNTALQFLEKKFLHAVDVQSIDNSLSWQEIDYKGLRKREWSGFIDLNQSSTSQLHSSGSELDFPKNRTLQFQNDASYTLNESSYGETIQLNDTQLKTVYEQYVLIHSGYKVALEGDTLYFHYDTTLPLFDADSQKAVLLHNVSSFSITPLAQAMDIRVCVYKGRLCSQKTLRIYE